VEHLTTTPDVRDLDCVYLATIAGRDYFELRQIVRQDSSVRSVIGRASDWPLIERDARIAELTALLTASEQRSVEADVHCVELLSRLSAYEELFAVTPPPEPRIAAAADAPAPARSDGRIPCDYPGCLDWVKPRGLHTHKRQAHGITGLIGHKGHAPEPSMDERRKCPYCTSRPKGEGMQSHIARAHPEHAPTRAVATPPAPIAIALGERPWVCEQCHESTHARSLKVPNLCIRCVVSLADVALTNGHSVAA